MRHQRIVCDVAERPEAMSVRSGARAPALAPRKFSAAAIHLEDSDAPEASARIARGKSGTAELKIEVDGLPVLFRFPLGDRPAETASHVVGGPAMMRSWLSKALGKIVDQLRGPAERGESLPSSPALISAETGSDGGPVIEPPVAQTMLRVGSLNLNLLDRTARRRDRQIDLRPREFQLLRYMMERSGKLLTRAELFRDVWHYKFVPQTNLVDVQMGRLRRKIDGPNEPPMIRSVRGAGFVIDACRLSRN
jgi:DNA-binding winged helix-turn-helix (wHTH) protein